MATKPKRPRDPNQLAKLIVDISTGRAADETPNGNKDAAAIARGRRGGLKGGNARASKLSAKRRQEIAKRAALSRWSKR